MRIFKKNGNGDSTDEATEAMDLVAPDSSGVLARAREAEAKAERAREVAAEAARKERRAREAAATRAREQRRRASSCCGCGC